MKLNTSDKYKNLNLFDDQYFVQLIQRHILGTTRTLQRD